MTKSKSDVKVLKGQEAEDKVLEYVKCMNRPYGAVDVAANLKGAVPKATTQKILLALAEKGELVQKTYGKTTFFVANQAKIASLGPEQLSTLDEEFRELDEDNKNLAAQIKSATNELNKVKNTPSDLDLEEQVTSVEDAALYQITKRVVLLQPLRSGAPPMSTAEIAQIDADWVKWRAEWVQRKKIFNSSGIFPPIPPDLTFLHLCSLWHLATDALSPQDALILAEDLGIELDTPEHAVLERSPICANINKNILKRKR
ncbi:TBPIP-domain-containing protein [Rhodocollybia butyracea]|uniref:TBPIP-domain-containing protein n=1 Tax=Rhodocollybia butyracea TaxID=206335 RepID=A0A9P5U9D0_9AGAR|nr:TBPIP-domain-containing protein [Rhodocollybia butyracea]